MSARRLEVRIDVLDRRDQRALPLGSLSPGEMVAAILQEFREIEYMGIDPGDYVLLAGAGEDAAELDPSRPIGDQVDSGAHLRLVERPRSIPPGAHPPSAALYLREESGGRVYPLAWLPAIIGRSDPTLPADALVAANLEVLPTGLRVSRRHIRIREEGGRYYAECLSSNGATLRPAGGSPVALGRAAHPINGGDVLFLDRSEIALKFIVREPQTAQPPPAAETQAELGN